MAPGGNNGKQTRYSFEYKGRKYSGHIVSSTDIIPHFHWFVFDDREIIEKYGDSIAFKVVNGKILPLYHLTSPDFVDAVKACVIRVLEGVYNDKRES